jgi:hypothetical protein
MWQTIFKKKRSMNIVKYYYCLKMNIERTISAMNIVKNNLRNRIEWEING